MVEYKYSAWGTQLSRTGELANTLGYANPFRYRGYIYDDETWMYWLRSRYYYPELHRFISADNVYIGNLFSYCDNMPTSYTDACGYAKAPVGDYRPVGSNYPDWFFRIDQKTFLDMPHIHMVQFRHNTIVQEFSIKANGEPHENSQPLTKKAEKVLSTGNVVKKKWPPRNHDRNNGNGHGSGGSSFSTACYTDADEGVVQQQSYSMALSYSLPFSTGLAGLTNGSYMPTFYEPSSFSLPSFGFSMEWIPNFFNKPIMEICYGY